MILVATTLTIRFKGVMAGLRQTRKRYKASDHLREHIARHSKSIPEMVKIDPVLNDFMMSRVVKGGSKVKVEISKVGDVVNAKLAPGQMAAKPQQQAQAKAPSKPAAQKQQVSESKSADKAAKQQAEPRAEKPKKEKQAKPKADAPAPSEQK